MTGAKMKDSSWIFKKLRSSNSSSSSIFNALVEMRSRFIKEPNGVLKLRTEGGIELLLGLIQRPNSKIVDISLSILGNCCMDKGARDEVRKQDGITAIVRVMTCLESDSIQNRACRALANIALDSESAPSMRTNCAVSHVTKFLANTEDPLCQQTALRALRILCEQKEHRETITECESAKVVSKLLSTKDDSVLQVLLRTMIALTEKCNASCTQQIDEAGGLTELVRICTEAMSPVQKETALHVLANVASGVTIICRMANVGAIEEFVSNAKGSDHNSAIWRWSATGLCRMSRVTAIHDKIIAGEGLPVLLNMLDKERPIAVRRTAVTTLACFIHSKTHMGVLVDLGLVKALVDMLREDVENKSSEHQPVEVETWLRVARSKFQTVCEDSSMGHRNVDGRSAAESLGPYWLGDRRPTFCISSPSYRAVCAETSRESRRESWSPESRGSTSASPESSPMSSPKWPGCPSPGYYPDSPASSIAMSTFLDPCYSPICEMSTSESDSDRESTVRLEADGDTLDAPDEDETLLGASDNMNDAELNLLETFPPSEEGESTAEDSDGRKALSNCSLLLLLQMSFTERQFASLLTIPTLQCLLDYVAKTFPFAVRAGRILTRLTRNPLCFERLVIMQMVTRIIPLFKDLPHQPEECTHCKSKIQLVTTLLGNLRDIANSPFGTGEIAHLLAVYPVNEKTCAAISAAHLLQSRQQRYRIMVKYRALQVLLDAAKDPKCLHFSEATKGLSTLAVQLFGKSGRTIRYEGPVSHHCAYEQEGRNHDVTLVTDEEEEVAVSRKRLCVESVVFCSMLAGNFSEATQHQVRVGGAGQDALGFVVHHLYGCEVEKCPRMSTAPLDTMLEALQLADRFLLIRLQDEIANMISVKKLSGKESFSVYQHARHSNCPRLMQYGLKYLLTADEDRIADNFEELVLFFTESLTVALEDIRLLLIDAIR